MKRYKTFHKYSLRRVVVQKFLIHGIADCLDCDWKCQDYNTVQKQSRKHTSKTGHRVSMELGYAVKLSSIDR